MGKNKELVRKWMIKMEVYDIEEHIEYFMSRRKANLRYSSFDYCYAYFLNTEDLIEDIEKSSLELGFYLASWGMFRGSSFLLKKSVKHFQKTIEYIDSLEKSIWEIDVDNYNENTLDTLLEIYGNLYKTLEISNHNSVILVTKTMLGVFGITPAFDKYFSNSFKKLSMERGAFNSFDIKSLKIIKEFYRDNKDTIDKFSKNVHCLDFNGETTNIHYTKAKIIDMYGFSKGILKNTKD